MSEIKSKTFSRIGTGAAGLAVLLVIIGAVNLIIANLRLRVDLTAEKLYTLSDGSRQVLGKPVEEVGAHGGQDEKRAVGVREGAGEVLARDPGHGAVRGHVRDAAVGPELDRIGVDLLGRGLRVRGECRTRQRQAEKK